MRRFHFDLRGPRGNALLVVADARTMLRDLGHDTEEVMAHLEGMPQAAESYQEVLDAVENAFDEADHQYYVDWTHPHE